jgi:hypothetical protein
MALSIDDVLLQLHTFLHRPLELDEWIACSHPQQERIVRAWDRALGLIHTSSDGNATGGWRERLARCFGVAKSPPTTSTVSTAGVARIRLEPRDRRYEEGILRIDLLAAQFAAASGSNKKSTSDGMKWVGLVRDDVLARRRGIVHPHDLERCWSLLVE